MDELSKLIQESVDAAIEQVKSPGFLDNAIKEGKLEPEDEMVTMLATNLEEDNKDPYDDEVIQVQGYGAVKVGDIKYRIRKMLTESLLYLNENQYGNLNHHFGLNSVGSSFITALTKFYDQKADEQDPNLQ